MMLVVSCLVCVSIGLFDSLFAALWQDDIRARMAARNSAFKTVSRPQNRSANVRLVPLRARAGAQARGTDKNATFGQRRSHTSAPRANGKERASAGGMEGVRFNADGGVEMSWVPSAHVGADDRLVDDDGGRAKQSGKGKEPRRKGVEAFGAGMERGGEEQERDMSESERKGRTKRRQGMRSGSKNTFRRM